MNPYWTLLLIAALIIAIIALSIGFRIKRERKQIIRDVRGSFGQHRRKGLAASVLNEYRESAEQYARQRGSDVFFIDDITWNDLEAKSLFDAAAHTFSDCGTEVLYRMMRCPAMSVTELKRRCELFSFFAESENVRTQLQTILADASIRQKRSVFLQMQELKKEEPTPCSLQAVLAALSAVSIAGLFLVPIPCLAALVGLCTVNIAVYLKTRDLNRTKLNAMRHLLRILHTADSVGKMISVGVNNGDPFANKVRDIRSHVAALAGIARKGRFLTGARSVSGGAGDLIISYLSVFFHVETIAAASVLKEIRGDYGEIEALIEDLGCLDVSCAVPSYRASLELWCEPELQARTEKDEAAEAFLDTEGLAHPDLEKPVRSSCRLTGLNVFTGSNASGKSTYLKSLAVSALLAQSIATAPCRRYAAPFFRILTSMALRDDLRSGESYYIVELRSILRMIRAAEEKTPLLCVIDEVLRGTNTTDRIAASAQILSSLSQPHVLTAAATHDQELAQILNRIASNWHFGEEVAEGDVRFSYELCKGPARSRNALRLLSAYQYPEDIVVGAQRAAEKFEKNKIWEQIPG